MSYQDERKRPPPKASLVPVVRTALTVSVVLAIITASVVGIAAARETAGRRFTQEELKLYDGTKGRPPYVAVDGNVYDVSASEYWKNGLHEETHRAGADLTAELRASPHGKQVIGRMVQVGILAKSTGVPASLETFLGRYPVFRRHPHPFFVHFPVAFLFAASVFMILSLYRPRSMPFERMAFVMLIMAFIFTPPAIISGLWSWWLVYNLEPLPQVFYKIALSATLFAVEIGCLFMRIRRPFEQDVREWTYFGLMLYLGVAALATGYLGGQLTYGY